ncbi:hypothetical protein COY16_00400 [Candidatus Roizmanbacteria bacterium CG_4_10_14_0_2_um_filter_39_13]|uniref:SCP domain-containing protein n=1 Tax=Candidatus Roizmanbacteria bacterium CG_4_10_14_0_2_um_filter_39_13 TaxID=1974825 RepID=A0A2M7U1P3_9BACT|nr:MAG: hypothetical protein COY16_00400 [Candidatus Roizmanbacteria bacterium CG_4_10_14_0_2_um_filter_39_13]
MNHIKNAFHHLFLPKHTNNFRAKILHHDFLTVYLVFALVLTVGITHLQNTSGSILGYATDISTSKLLELTNVERAQNNLPALTRNEKLEKAAQAKAQDMFEKNYWSHYGPSGETPWEFILASGYQYEYAGENLAKNFLFSDGVVQAWMDSETHRENLLRPEYTDVGFAVVNGVINDEETTLVVQEFGKPLYSTSKVESNAPQEQPVTATDQIVENIPNPLVLADSANAPFYASYLNINLLFFSVLILALILDFYFASKLNLIHIKGKNLIHILFIGFVMIGTFIVINGSIL